MNDRFVHGLFEAQAARTPEAVAVISGGESLTYGDLNRRSNQLAHDLIRLRLPPETVVAVYVPRSPVALISLLAILKSGLTYISLDPDQPRDRLCFVLRDTAAAVLLTAGGLRDRLPSDGLLVLDLDEAAERLRALPETDPVNDVWPEQLAYCVFTSGSTGVPKGVAVSHASLFNHAAHMAEELGIRSTDRVLQFTPLAIDASLEEILPTWIGGAMLVMPSMHLPPPADFVRAVRDEQITVVSLPTSFWHYWVDELARSPETWPRTLRVVFVGGEKVEPEKFRRWRELPCTARADWIVDYGPCEATISCTTFSPDRSRDWDVVPIGRPIRNVHVYVLDGDDRRTPPGVVGEIHIAGVGLARGYLNRSALTAETFVPDPFSTSGSRMYKTGDLGCVLPDGNIQFVGRADRQVKLLGRRIELGEIESALLRCPGVRDAVVLLRDGTAGPQLVAYIVSVGFSDGAIRAHLSEMLPAVMIPAVLVPLDELPLSPFTGKIDRTRLAAIAIPARTATVAGSPLERALATLWTDAIGCVPQSLDDDFFLAGGDSLRALALIGRIGSLTGCEIPFATFAQSRTIRLLASALLTQVRSRNPGGDLDVEQSVATQLTTGEALQRYRLRRRVATRRPASRAQQRLWFLSRLQERAPTYSVPLAYRVRGELAIEKLDRALTTIVERHEALRTVLVQAGGELWQQILPPAPIRTRERHVASFDEAVAVAHGEASTPFDLSVDLPFRSLCIRIDDHDALLMVNFHHLACDAWSHDVFWRELTAFYSASSLSPIADEAPFQYGDYVDFQQAWLHSAAADAQREFWRRSLVGPLPVLQRSTISSGDDPASNGGAIEPWRVDSAVAGAIRQMARRDRTTDFVVVLSAFAALLRRFTGDEEIVIGVPAACRSIPDTHATIGYFSNTLPIRLSIPTDSSVRRVVADTARALSAAMSHQELPFDEIVDALGVPRRAGANPLFQAMLVFQTTPLEGLVRLGDAEVEEVIVHTGTAKFDLTCTMRAMGEGWGGELEYSLDMLDSASARTFVDAFVELLDDMTARPSARIGELRLLAAQPARRIVEAATGSAHDYGRFDALHALVERQVARTPDAIAVDSDGQTIRYDELNARANRLARRLIAAGTLPEQRVGVCVPRSIDLVVALLATLKTGAAFVPLDVRFPLERLRNICSDAETHIVIVQERHRAPLSGLPAQLLVVDESVSMDGAAENLDVQVPAAQAAYVYYTSGSTGRPKGVVLDHACTMNRLEWLRRRYPLSRGDCVIQKTPLIFDVAIWEIFGPLLSGATILMAEADRESDVPHLRGLLERRGTVFVHFVPSMLNAYLNVAGECSYPDLRWVSLSGEALSTRLLEKCRRHFGVDVHNLYGQTETSEVAGWEHGISERANVPIGRQIGIYRLYVLDEGLAPVPPGVPGEICVAGVDGLARGYHAQPSVTAEKFVPNPYALIPGERLYRTGDLGRMSADGVIEYIGRADGQRKVRGCRVETAEIEAVLSRHPAVAACAVVVRVDETGGEQIVAYVVGTGCSAANLGEHAATFLPRYMLPEGYVFLSALPLTPSGKLDRLALPAPSPTDFEARGAGEPPRTALEQSLASMWSEVLGLNAIGRKDNFFAIGGNSLKCIQILARTAATYQVDVTVREFFDAPTIERLASVIERRLVVLVRSLSDEEVGRRLGELAG